MKEKLLALLINGFAGVRKDGLAHLAGALALNVTTEEEAQALVGKLTKDQVDTFIKDFRASVDKEVSDGNSTFKANLEKKYDLVEKGNHNPEPNKKTDPNKPDDLEAKLEALLNAKLAPLQEKLSGFEKGEVSKTRLQSLTDKLKTCNDEGFKTRILKDFGRMSFETDDAFNEYLQDTETDIATANQNVANSGFRGHSKPIVPNTQPGVKEASKEEIDAIMERLPGL